MSDETESKENETQGKEIDKLKQSFLTRLSGKISLRATFAAVAGSAALLAAVIAAPAFVPITGAIATAAAITAAGIGITWAFSQDNDYRKLPKRYGYYTSDEMTWRNYYKNSKLTKDLGKLSIRGVFATTILGAATAATAIAAGPLLPLVPLIGAAATASATVTTGTGTVYVFRKNGR